MESGKPPEADAALTAASLRAIASAHPDVTIEALAKRMFMRGEWMRQLEKALEDRPAIEAYFERRPHQSRLYGIYLTDLGQLLFRSYAYEEAMTTFERW